MGKKGMSADEKRQVIMKIFTETEDVVRPSRSPARAHRPHRVVELTPIPLVLIPTTRRYLVRARARSTAIASVRTYNRDHPRRPRAQFVLKDLEKLASKRGINAMVVKDLLQGMADDDMIHMEKIGSSNYYWAFPSEAAVKLAQQHAALQAALQAAQKQKTALDCELATAQALLLSDGDGGDEMSKRAALMASVAERRERRDELARALAPLGECDPEVHRTMAAAVEVTRQAANRWIDNLDAARSWLRRKFEGHDKELRTFFRQAGVPDDLEPIPAPAPARV